MDYKEILQNIKDNISQAKIMKEIKVPLKEGDEGFDPNKYKEKKE